MKKRITAFLITAVLLLSITIPCALAVSEDIGYIRVEAGQVHVVALKEDGTVWTWGSNICGALGDGTQKSRYVPTRVNGLTDIVDIFVGWAYTFALKADGTVWGWGSNWAGQMGISASIMGETFVPIQLEGFAFPHKEVDESGEYKILGASGYDYDGEMEYDFGIKADGSVWHKGVELKEFFGARDVSMGMEGNSYIVTADGTLMVMGDNRYGQLGSGFSSKINIPQRVEGISGVKDVSVCYNIYVLHNDGTVSDMGSAGSKPRFTKVSVDDVVKIVQTVRDVYILKSDGSVWRQPIYFDNPDVGAQELTELVKVEELSNIVNIKATWNHAIAIDKDGKAYVDIAWNEDDALFSADSELTEGFNLLSGIEAVKDGCITDKRITLLTTDGRVLTAYRDTAVKDNNEIRPISGIRALKELDIGGAAKAVETVGLYPGDYYIVLKADGTVCVLSQENGIDKYEYISGMSNITDICTNNYSVLGLDAEGYVWQLGADGGNLGIDDIAEYMQPYRLPWLKNIAAIAAGDDFSSHSYFAVTHTGELHAWGDNAGNRLFSNDTAQYTEWRPVKSSVINMTIGDSVILVNGYEVAIPAAPVIVDSRTLVPIREIAENLGGTVEWEEPGQITIRMKQDILILNIGSREAWYNGEKETIDIAPALIDGKTFLPLRYICERLGADVIWEETAQRISITK